MKQKGNLRISCKWVSTHGKTTRFSQAKDRERDEAGERFSRYHNKRRQINAFGLESNQHYSDNSPPANTHLTPARTDIINSPHHHPLPLPPFLSVRQSSLNVFLYPRALLLRAAAPPTDTSLVLLIPRADDKYANKRTTGTDIRGKYWGRLKAELTPRSHKRSSTLPHPPVLPRQC